MNIFRPYLVLKDDPDLIHLQLTKTRSVLIRVFLLASPFLLLLFGIAVPVLLSGTDFPLWPQVVFVALMALSIFLVLRAEVVMEVMITPTEIRQRYVSMLKSRYRLIPVTEVRSIMLERIYVRSRGYYYYLFMKDGRKKVLFSLPRFSMDPMEEATIKEKLQGCTGLTLEKYSL
jgi:hypothetical protein